TLLVLIGAAASLRLAALLLCCPFGRRTATAAATPAGRGRRGDRRLHAQIPARGLDAGLRAVREQGAADLAHVFARRVADLQAQFADRLLVDPRYDGGRLRILAVEHLIAPELVVAIARRPAIHRVGRRREQLRVGRRRLRSRVLLDRLEMVEDPQRPAVRREDRGILARLDGDLVDAYCRQVGFHPCPRLRAID